MNFLSEALTTPTEMANDLHGRCDHQVENHWFNIKVTMCITKYAWAMVSELV